MIRTKRLVLMSLSALILSGFMPIAAAPSASDYLPASVITRITSHDGIFASSSGKNTSLSLVPQHSIARGMEAAILAEEPSVIVEALFLWKKPHAAAADAEMLAVYNVLRAVGSLTGIEYYSASRKRMRLLYEYSSLVAGANDSTPLSDRRIESLPSHSESLYARQKDTTFGDNRYGIIMSSETGYVTQVSSNLNQLYLGILPVAAPGNIRLRILVLSVEDAIIFYAVSSAKAVVIPGIKATLETSFGNRVTAIYGWFSRELSAAWPSIR